MALLVPLGPVQDRTNVYELLFGVEVKVSEPTKPIWPKVRTVGMSVVPVHELALALPQDSVTGWLGWTREGRSDKRARGWLCEGLAMIVKVNALVTPPLLTSIE